MIIPGYESALLLAKDPVMNGEYYRILTVALLHGGLLHLGFNLYSLHLLGTPVEAFFGKGRYLTIFISSLIAASFASLTFNSPYVYSIGASGAIFGLFGAWLGNKSTTMSPLLVCRVAFEFGVLVTWRPGESNP